MSSYIVAHIVFDNNELKSVDIVNDTHTITSGTIDQNISPLNIDFYIKILVEKCDSQSPNCFGLSNGTYYRMLFNPVNTSNQVLVNGDFLKNSGVPNIINGNGNGPNGVNTGANPIGTNQSPSINEFTVLIVKALTRTFGIEGFKELIVKALSQDFSIVKKSSLKEFNDRIVNALQTVTPTN